MQIKLYTEEEVMRIVKIAFWQDFEYGTTEEDVLNKAKTIQLPSEEEIEIKGDEFSNRASYTECFKEGATWVIEQIKQQVIP